LVLDGVPDLTKLISDMRKQGWTIHSQKIPYAAAARRVNEHAILKSPKNLPVKEILRTRYWVSKGSVYSVADNAASSLGSQEVSARNAESPWDPIFAQITLCPF